jgi:mono/diheme cytochrome c family protein
MKGFAWGILFTLFTIFVVFYGVVHSGYLDFRADAPPSSLEKRLAMRAMDESTDHHATVRMNPLQPTEATLVAGARLYHGYCAGCHGDPNNMDTKFGDSFNPPAPQFWMDAPDMPDYQNFYIIEHGVRWTGMPAWGKQFKEEQIWQLATLLAHIDKLPPAADQELRKPVSTTPTP